VLARERCAGVDADDLGEVPGCDRYPRFTRESPLHLGGEPQHDVEPRGQLARARAFDRREVDDDGLARLAVRDRLQHAVALIPGLALDVALRGPLVAPLHLEREVDVARAPRIEHGLDRAEVVLAGRPSHEAAEALEVLLALRMLVARVEIDAVV